MIIGVPKEIKNNEFRVALTPQGVDALVKHGHTVYIQAGAGIGSSISDDEYIAAGAQLLPSAEAVWADADMIMKVKEPIEPEYELMREGQILFTYLHLAADRPLTEKLLEKKVTSIAYETVQTDKGGLPLLSPMSEVAGRLSAQVAANLLMKSAGGRGILMGGTAGTARAKTIVLGGGTAGYEAAKVAAGMGSRVTVFDVNIERLMYLEDVNRDEIDTAYSTPLAVAEAIKDADVVIGSVLIPGARTPRLVTNEMVATMKPGSVLVDIAIDQGGCFEDSHPTTHADPTFTVHNSTFYCVANMPGVMPRTSTYALTNATMRYALLLADKGWKKALNDHTDLLRGLTTHNGELYCESVALAFDMGSKDPVEAIK
ncbi:alanine dehydrogenase [Arcanobacterium pluranimalium]|uniref:alanine dehydrogenase n=1 Tax=Arcanobacterium pluranimalium TaxID=108028 RepID=UPI00195A3F22|nr:alanine dehydrogenase [Arcanobacterium pluranimalium]MBM7825685.1 alanine dehydrogenase [Arcanobacterium pluranimalium]